MRGIKSIFNFIFAIGVVAVVHTAPTYAAANCKKLLGAGTENPFHQPAYKEAALKIMLEGSMNVSRTVARGETFFDQEDKDAAKITDVAEVNFLDTAQFMLENFDILEINLETATELNKMLTRGLVPDEEMGNFQYRPHGVYANQIEKEVGRTPQEFYVTWLNSDAAKKMFVEDPIGMAEVVHNAIASLDSFPDGNGRLSRLFADFILIKSGNPPAAYTTIDDYFARGNSRATVARSVRIEYFREAVERARQQIKIKKSSSRKRSAHVLRGQPEIFASGSNIEIENPFQNVA